MRPQRLQVERVMQFRVTARVGVRRSRAGQGVALMLLGGFLLLILWLGYRDISTLRDLQAQGRTTYALITDKQISSGKSTSYYLYYTFLANDTAIRSRASVSRSRYQAAWPGSSLLVTYLPANPSVNRAGIVDEARIRRAQLGWGIFLFLFAVFSVIIAWASFYQSRARKAVIRRIL